MQFFFLLSSFLLSSVCYTSIYVIPFVFITCVVCICLFLFLLIDRAQLGKIFYAHFNTCVLLLFTTGMLDIELLNIFLNKLK